MNFIKNNDMELELQLLNNMKIWYVDVYSTAFNWSLLICSFFYFGIWNVNDMAAPISTICNEEWGLKLYLVGRTVGSFLFSSVLYLRNILKLLL